MPSGSISNPSGSRDPNSSSTRTSQVKLLTMNKMNKDIKKHQSMLRQTVGELDGECFENGDDSDPAVSEIQANIRDLMAECDEHTKSSFIKKFVGSIPLPLFLPAMRERSQALLRLAASEVNMKTSTSGRKRYGAVTGFAFKSPDVLSSLPRFPVENSKWSPKFHLIETASLARACAILGCTHEEFLSWWGRIRTDTSSNKSWADLKALCKSIVFIYDDISVESAKCIPHIAVIKRIARMTQNMSVMLVKQLSGNPKYARSISAVFGFIVPLVFVLSKIVDEAIQLRYVSGAIMNVKAEQLEPPLLELDALVQDTESWLVEFGVKLKCLSAMAQLNNELDELQTGKTTSGLSFAPRPSFTQLFGMDVELDSDANRLVLESGLEKSKETLDNTVALIHRKEIARVHEKFLNSDMSEKDSAYDVRMLQRLGIPEMIISDTSAGILGHGSSSIVYSYSCRNDASHLVAVKSYKNRGGASPWNDVIQEATIWATLKHKNVLPLLGYCTLSSEGMSEQYPALVSPTCPGRNLRLYLKGHPVTVHQKMQFLHDISSGLAYMHSKRVCHGDLRAANILVYAPSGSPTAVIGDFGLSSFFDETPGRLYDPIRGKQTMIKWKAPELVNADRASVSSEGDVYAFGCVILEVAYEKEPYQIYPAGSEKDAILRGELPAQQWEMSDVYWHAASKCWVRAPESRPKANQVAIYLEHCLCGEQARLE
ncbi:hypothetical protein ACEPAI_4419 [Sanghuangporus weigelae]